MSSIDLDQRLVGILAADVASYSRLMAADERATVVALDAARAIFKSRIESNQGRVIDMAGDSVLAVFKTATGATSAALAIQQELTDLNSNVAADRRMHFRIGVHLGDVIEKPDGTVYGNGINIAARLQALAEPGGIVVSQSVYVEIHGKVNAEYDDRGEQTVKNIADPIHAFGVVPAKAGARAKAGDATAEAIAAIAGKPSIAVLPFNNMSGDPEQEYFSDGMVEDITTELSRSRELFVIARNSSFTCASRQAAWMLTTITCEGSPNCTALTKRAITRRFHSFAKRSSSPLTLLRPTEQRRTATASERLGAGRQILQGTSKNAGISPSKRSI